MAVTLKKPTSLYTIDSLKEKFKDFARPNLYTVEFNINSPNISQEIIKVEMSVKSTNIPSFDIGKLDVKRMGQKFSVPTSQNFGDVQMTVFCDKEYTQRKFFHTWLTSRVYDTNNNKFIPLSKTSKDVMRIIQFDNKFNPIFITTFYHIWPTSISEIQLSQDSDTLVVEFPITLTYSRYHIESVK